MNVTKKKNKQSPVKQAAPGATIPIEGLKLGSEAEQYAEQSKSGLLTELPALEAIPNEFGQNYEVQIIIPEYSAICPLTHQPDYGVITITFVPNKAYLELKALKFYIQGFRNVGVFYESVVNRILEDIVNVIEPISAQVKGEFSPRGGIRSVITAKYEAKKSS